MHSVLRHGKVKLNAINNKKVLIETRQDDNKGHYHCWFLCNFQVTRCKSMHYPISCIVLYTIYYKSHKPASSSELVFTYFMLSKYLCVPNTHHKYNIFYALFYSLFPLRKSFETSSFRFTRHIFWGFELTDRD